MTISEKAAYLKGLMDGLKLDTEKAEGKMIAAIVELMGDLPRIELFARSAAEGWDCWGNEAPNQQEEEDAWML